jgi:hypothetical protein
MEAGDGSLLDTPAADIPDDDLLALEERLSGDVKMEYEPTDFSSGEFSSFGGESMFGASDPMAAVGEMNHFELDHAMQGLMPPAVPGNELFQLPAGFSWADEDSTPSSAPVSAPGSYISNSGGPAGEKGLATRPRPSLGNDSDSTHSTHSNRSAGGQSDGASGGTKKKNEEKE